MPRKFLRGRPANPSRRARDDDNLRLLLHDLLSCPAGQMGEQVFAFGKGPFNRKAGKVFRKKRSDWQIPARLQQSIGDLVLETGRPQVSRR